MVTLYNTPFKDDLIQTLKHREVNNLTQGYTESKEGLRIQTQTAIPKSIVLYSIWNYMFSLMALRYCPLHLWRDTSLQCIRSRQDCLTSDPCLSH